MSRGRSRARWAAAPLLALTVAGVTWVATAPPLRLAERTPAGGTPRPAPPVGDAQGVESRRSADPGRDHSPTTRARIRWRSSVAVGLPSAGSLERGVRLPAEGRGFFTWDPIRRSSPNRAWRRWGTDLLVRTLLEVAADFAAEHPEAPRIGIGDLSRPYGGDFGPRFGLPGHASHQNGLDADLYYPRLDRRERPPRVPSQIDRGLAQDLVDRLVAAGAEKVFVGPSTGLGGPPGVVAPLANHDNHLHLRLPG